MLISVIMNCYNSQKYLSEAINSVLNQTYKNWEIIFWDNQSTDGSAEIFKSYNDNRFKYYYASEHTPLGQARNNAIEKAQGDWCAFLDCDDVWLPDKLEKQVAIIISEDKDLGLVYGHMKVILEENGTCSSWGRNIAKYFNYDSIKNILPEGRVFNELLLNDFIPLSSAIIRRSFFWSVGAIDPNITYSEDYDLFIKLCKIYKCRAVQSFVCLYRVHENNISHSNLEQGFRESFTIMNRYLPLKSAVIGLKHHHTAYAIYLLRSGFIIRGLIHLLKEGSSIALIKKIHYYIFRR